MHPHIGEARHVELAHAIIRKTNLEGDIVLHGNSEAVTEHSRGPQAPKQLLRQVAIVLFVFDGLLEKTKELDAGVIDGVALLDGYTLNLVPGELTKSRNHALEGTLGAIAREGRLAEQSSK